MDNIDIILLKISKSKFRSGFKLSEKEADYIRKNGLNKIREHAYEFIRKRLAGEYLENDGKQTPMRGHPVFVAQHATAICCRSCLYKWHHIEKGRALTEKEIDYIVNVIMRWIQRNLE